MSLPVFRTSTHANAKNLWQFANIQRWREHAYAALMIFKRQNKNPSNTHTYTHSEVMHVFIFDTHSSPMWIWLESYFICSKSVAIESRFQYCFVWVVCWSLHIELNRVCPYFIFTFQTFFTIWYQWIDRWYRVHSFPFCSLWHHWCSASIESTWLWFMQLYIYFSILYHLPVHLN